jgi:hypothetical protein
MSPITDDDLVLYHYRDGLDVERIAQIESALETSPSLRERYAAINHAVANFGQDEIVPDADLNARLWHRIEPQLAKSGTISAPANVSKRSSVIDRLRASFTPAQLWPGFAVATVLFAAIGVAFFAGRQSVTVSPPVASTEADAAAARVLDAYVAANLRTTERVLLTASNSEDASLLEGNRELAQSLVESNRLYALAAARSGNARLANFLRQLEPVLMSLANQSGHATVQSSEDLRHFLETTDLLFQVRATQAGLDRNGERRAPNTDGDTAI